MWGSYGAFTSCANLTEIVFAENSRLEVIKQNSFLGIGVEKLELPASLTELESFSIYGENMTEVVVGEGNTYFKTVDGVLYSADGKKLILYPGGKQGETFTSPRRHGDNRRRLLQQQLFPAQGDFLRRRCFA